MIYKISALYYELENGFQSQIILCLGGCSVHLAVSLSLLIGSGSNFLVPVVTIKIASRYCQMVSEGKNHLQLKITELYKETSFYKISVPM